MRLILSFLICSIALSLSAATSIEVDGLYHAQPKERLHRLLNGDDTNLVNGDVDGDGVITSADVTTVYNQILGQ